MSTKLLNFLSLSWFLSILICLAMEGSYVGTNENSVINSLSVLTTLNIGGLLTVPALNLNFFSGAMRVLLWDYSFYSGGYAIVRYFWIATLDPGAAWGIGMAFAWVYSSFIKPF